MNRKEAILRSAYLMGGIAFAPSALGVLNGCTAKPGVTWNPRYFNREQARLVTVLSDVIIPETDTPGAVQAGVPAFIEDMVIDIYDETSRSQFMSGLEVFNQEAQEQLGSNYADLDHENQFNFADKLNQHAIKGAHRNQPDVWFFFIMKELTLLGFFTSEPGATQTLQYLRIPGRYEGCVPLEEIGRAWA